LEAARAHRDRARSALRLHGVRPLGPGVRERAGLDGAAVAADHVDRRAARAPALEARPLDAEAVDSGELQAVVVAAGADVGDAAPGEAHAARRLVALAAVVDVDAVPARAGHRDVAQLHVARPHEVDGRVAAAEERRMGGVLPGDDDRLPLLARQTLEE